MSYTVEFLPEAIVDLEALTSSIQERILRKILGYLKISIK